MFPWQLNLSPRARFLRSHNQRSLKEDSGLRQLRWLDLGSRGNIFKVSKMKSAEPKFWKLFEAQTTLHGDVLKDCPRA